MKKLLSLLLTATMLCALTLPVLATTPADNAQTRNADIFDFIDILEDCVGMIELTPVEVYDHNKNGVVDIFDGIIVLEGIIGLGDCVRMPVEQLDRETKQRIIDDYYVKYNSVLSDSVFIEITHCFGIYNGSAALWIDCNEFEYYQMIWEDIVAEYTFSYNDSQQIWIWNEGKFYTVTEAYDNGLLTEDDVGEICTNYENWKAK